MTPGRSLKIHLVLSASSTFHSVARPGIIALALSDDDRSHIVSASYIVRPVKRLPSKPWSGWPSVRGISAAVMPIRSTVSALAIAGSAGRQRERQHACAVALVFLLRICNNPFETPTFG